MWCQRGSCVLQKKPELSLAGSDAEAMLPSTYSIDENFLLDTPRIQLEAGPG